MVYTKQEAENSKVDETALEDQQLNSFNLSRADLEKDDVCIPLVLQIIESIDRELREGKRSYVFQNPLLEVVVNYIKKVFQDAGWTVIPYQRHKNGLCYVVYFE